MRVIPSPLYSPPFFLLPLPSFLFLPSFSFLSFLPSSQSLHLCLLARPCTRTHRSSIVLDAKVRTLIFGLNVVQRRTQMLVELACSQKRHTTTINYNYWLHTSGLLLYGYLPAREMSVALGNLLSSSSRASRPIGRCTHVYTV